MVFTWVLVSIGKRWGILRDSWGFWEYAFYGEVTRYYSDSGVGLNSSEIHLEGCKNDVCIEFTREWTQSFRHSQLPPVSLTAFY